MTISFIPETAPFSPPQRAWLNGFFAGVFGLGENVQTAVPPQAAAELRGANQPGERGTEVDEDFPWHDPALRLDDRLRLAAEKPLERKLMAAMAQLDCGACGYLCQTYAEAIARGEERDLARCAPGGSETAKALRQLLAAGNGQGVSVPRSKAAAPLPGPPQPAPGYSRSHPFPARLIESVRLTHVDSAKDTRHVVIDLLDSGIDYEPGDSLGICPRNDSELVDNIIRALGGKGDEPVATPDGPKPLGEALSCDFTLTRIRPPLVALLARVAADPSEEEALATLMQQDAGEFAATADVLDVLQRFPSARPSLHELLAALAKLQPRLYSISSSLKVHPGQVHLTVGVVRFERDGRWRQGVASGFLGVRSEPGDEVRIFVQRSPRFRLPEDADAPVIMVGPGTGIAPFRAFLQERRAGGAKGRNWLLFGNQHFDYDFLYRRELESFLDTGLLSRLDLAFSRDRAEKAYVQHRMLDNGAELWAWLEQGAHFYVCGDAKRMARDVEQALVQIVARHGRRSPEAATAYVAELAKSKRYQRDVY